MNLSRHHSFLLPLAALVLCAVMATPASAEQRASSTAEAPVAQAAASCGNSDAVGGEVSERALESSTVCLLNRERASRGLRGLRVNRRLSAAAQRHTDDMVRRRYFAHNSRSGASSGDRIRRTGYLKGARSWMVGENLARGSGSRSTPRSIVDSWMHSSGHRRNILTRRFREIGIGVASRAPTSGSSAAATYTTTFGQSG